MGGATSSSELDMTVFVESRWHTADGIDIRMRPCSYPWILGV
ncbi:MAG: hypothetical protein ACRDTJ_18730 [Pseudonocardiaceae bacterium]